MLFATSPLALLQRFQQGYIDRDLSKVDEFLNLFTENAEVIGTNGQKAGLDEWYPDRRSARELIEGDWQSWGDVRLDLASSRIEEKSEIAWVSCPCTVTQKFGADHYQSYLNFVKQFLETSTLPAEEKLHYILRGGTNTVYELHRGETFVWALRLTAVLLHTNEGWKFAQLHFSFPTIYFPDVRLFER